MTYALAAKLNTTSHLVRERLTDKERGASALEYVGMVLVAAFICAAVYLAFSGEGTDIKGKVSKAVSDILKGPGGQ